MRRTFLLDSVSELPEEFLIDEIIERLIIIEKIDKGRQQIKEGRVNSEDQAKVKLNK